MSNWASEKQVKSQKEKVKSLVFLLPFAFFLLPCVMAAEVKVKEPPQDLINAQKNKSCGEKQQALAKFYYPKPAPEKEARQDDSLRNAMQKYFPNC